MAIRRTANLQESELAWWYATGVEAWVKSLLERDLDQNNFDSLQDIWAQPVDYLPVDEGFVRGEIVDLQGRFNINNLGTADPEEYERNVVVFARLLRYLEVAEEYQSRAIAASIKDWIDADSEPTGADGAEDNDYLRLNPPYRAANRPMSSVSELLAIRGVTRDIYNKLVNLVVALPSTGVPINVNTAPAAVLYALATEPRPGIDTFVKERIERPAENISDLFNERAVFTAADAPSSMLSVSSAFFMLRSEVFIGSGRVALYSFYFRPYGGTPTVYGRSTNTE